MCPLDAALAQIKKQINALAFFTAMRALLRRNCWREVEVLLGDKGYDVDSFISSFEVRAVKVVIPPKLNRNRPALRETRSCVNNGRIYLLTSRSDAAYDASASSTNAARAYDIRIMIAHGFSSGPKRRL